MIFDVKFKTMKDRHRFERKYKITKENVIVDHHSNSYGFSAWIMMRDPRTEVVYFMGFMGYEDPKDILRYCKDKKINIKSLSWIPINDKGSKWEVLK